MMENNKLSKELSDEIIADARCMYNEDQNCGYVSGAVKYATKWQQAHELIQKMYRLKDLWLPIDSSIQHEDECVALHTLESNIENYLTHHQ